MDSNRDGKKGRHFASAFALYTQPLGNNINLSGNLSYLDYDSQEGYWLPVLGIDAVISQNAEVYLNGGQSVRVPTLNDLYLDMSSNQGNEALEVETTTSSELGLRTYSSMANFSASIFYKESEDVIDFTYTDAELAANTDADPDNNMPYVARNYGDTTIKGYDVELDASAVAMSLGLSAFKVTHTRIIQDIETELAVLKNTDGHIQNQSALFMAVDMGDYWQLSTNIKREDRFNSDYYEVLDLRLGYNDGNLSAALEGTNLLDAEYVDAGFVEVPGPGVRLEIGYKL
jgi:iron complex outermembrane receptor protein